MKVTLSSRKRIAITLIILGTVGFIVGTVVGLIDLMTVYRLTESIDAQDNSEIARQLKAIEIRTQLNNAMVIVSIAVLVIGMLLLLVKKHSRTYHNNRH